MPEQDVHIAGRGSVVRQLRFFVSQFRVLRTGTLSEIRPDNIYQPRDGVKTDKNKMRTQNFSVSQEQLDNIKTTLSEYRKK